jgi:hypothetical protein
MIRFALALIVTTVSGWASVIQQLPIVISLPGIYTLNRSLSGQDTGGALITIKANDVILDFDGYTISGSAQWGIHIMSGPPVAGNVGGGNVTVRNGCIRNSAGGGVFFDAVAFNKIGSLLIQCTANAVLDLGGSSNTVNECTLFSSGYNIPTVFLSGDRDAIISNCHVQCVLGGVAIKSLHSYHFANEIINNFVTINSGTPIEPMPMDILSGNGTYNDGI